MRILITFLAVLMLSGCTAMLMSGSASHKTPSECQENDTEDNGREC